MIGKGGEAQFTPRLCAGLLGSMWTRDVLVAIMVYYMVYGILRILRKSAYFLTGLNLSIGKKTPILNPLHTCIKLLAGTRA